MGYTPYSNTNPSSFTSCTGTVTSVTLACGTSGTDVNISTPTITTSGTITLNIPDAGASARGLVTTGTQTFGGDKTVSGTMTATHFYESSDINLKNIFNNAPVPDVNDLEMIVFKWKSADKGDKFHYGYTAQDVMIKDENLVNKDAHGYLSVNYMELHTLQIEDLKKRMLYLEKLIEKLGGSI